MARGRVKSDERPQLAERRAPDAFHFHEVLDLGGSVRASSEGSGSPPLASGRHPGGGVGRRVSPGSGRRDRRGWLGPAASLPTLVELQAWTASGGVGAAAARCHRWRRGSDDRPWRWGRRGRWRRRETSIRHGRRVARQHVSREGRAADRAKKNQPEPGEDDASEDRPPSPGTSRRQRADEPGYCLAEDATEAAHLMHGFRSVGRLHPAG